MKKKPAKKKLRELKTIIPNWIIEDGIAARIGVFPWAVYIILVEHANYQTGYCFPSYETIMKKTGIKDERTVAKAIATLQDEGLISYQYKKSETLKGITFGIGKHTYVLAHPSSSILVPKKP